MFEELKNYKIIDIYFSKDKNEIHMTLRKENKILSITIKKEGNGVVLEIDE